MKPPKDAREVYVNESGEPIAYCPRDSLGITDIERRTFFELVKADGSVTRLADRCREKGADAFVVIVIDVDDPAWTWLVDELMPGHDWDAYRRAGARPVARGVVPREPVDSADQSTSTPAPMSSANSSPILMPPSSSTRHVRRRDDAGPGNVLASVRRTDGVRSCASQRWHASANIHIVEVVTVEVGSILVKRDALGRITIATKGPSPVVLEFQMADLPDLIHALTELQRVDAGGNVSRARTKTDRSVALKRP